MCLIEYTRNEDNMKRSMIALDFENSGNKLADNIEKFLKDGK